MNRILISEAIGNIDDVFIEETMFFSEEDFGHPPERTTNMENKNINSRRIIGLVLAACLVVTFAVTAYAADIGGIRRKIQIWLFGDQTTAVLDIQDGRWTVTDEEGALIRSGGGITIDLDGTERPITEEEILEQLEIPDLVHKEDGSTWVYYHGQTIEITEEMYDEDGYCYLELRDGTEILFATIERNGGMATSPEKYVQPHQFGTTQEP